MPSLDPQRLSQIIDYFGRADAAEMIFKLIENFEHYIAKLPATEAAAVVPLAHTLKGLAGMYGLSDLAALAQSVEIGMSRPEDAPARLEAEIRAAQSALRDFLNALGAVKALDTHSKC
jgi:HPt (histidine-containing phosphotransfer) domain-containing protein